MTRGELAFVAGAADAGKRLDVALAARPEVGSRAAAQRLLESGAATVDGRARPKSHVLEEGDRIQVHIDDRPPTTGAAAGAQYEVAFKDASVLVVDHAA